MKHYLKFFVIVLVLTSCTKSNEDKAKEGVKDYLKTNMNDFKSYEPVEWGAVDSLFLECQETQEYKELNDSIAFYFDKSNNNTSHEEWQKYFDLHQKASNKLIVMLKMYKPKFDGYKIIHKYRGTNELGAMVLNETWFYLDKDFKVKSTN